MGNGLTADALMWHVHSVESMGFYKTTQHWLLHVECAWKATRVRVSVDGWLKASQCSWHPCTEQALTHTHIALTFFGRPRRIFFHCSTS